MRRGKTLGCFSHEYKYRTVGPFRPLFIRHGRGGGEGQEGKGGKERGEVVKVEVVGVQRHAVEAEAEGSKAGNAFAETRAKLLSGT